MKKIKFIKLAIAVSLLTLFSSCGYNGMVTRQENVERSWSDVEVQYQRRANLIDNLVETVKGNTQFEKETLVEIVEARAKASSLNVKADQLTPENIEKYQQAQGQLSTALGRFLMITENYPELKANQAFTDLRAELAGTENRVAQATRLFNESVSDYNSFIRSFPNNMTAGMFGFETKGYFKADEGTKNAPKVKF
jgi:LemA protein